MIETKHIPLWLRYFNFIAAFIYFILSFTVLINSNIELSIVFILFAVSLIIMSSVRIVVGIVDKQIPTLLRVSKIVTSILIIPLSIVILALPSLDEHIVVQLIAISFIVFSILKILLAIIVKNYYTWIRILLIVVSSVTIIIAGIELFVPNNTQTVFILLISVIFLVNGITRITESVVAYEIVKI